MADEVLAFHRAIREVIVIENRAGELHVIDQAGRNGNWMETISPREREIVAVAPSMVLGAGSQLGNVKDAGRLRLIGMLYEREGTFCVPITEDSYLMVTTAGESFLEVLKTLQDRLPTITQKGNLASESLAISSAVDADQAVRSFFANTRLCEPNSVHLEDATSNPATRSWQISGTYRPAHAVRTKRYYIELDARTGAVTKFQTRT